MVIGELLKDGAKQLGGEDAVREARLILSYVTGLSVTEIMIHPEKMAGNEQCTRFADFIRKRRNGMPFAYITGEKEFYGRSFKVSEDVLIPRPDTEILTEFAIKAAPGNLLDICTGSGCIAVSVAAECKKSRVTAIDISEKALDIAKENAKRYGADINFLKADIFTFVPQGKYDMIVSNPPYIKKSDIQKLETDVKNFEPLIALDGGENGLEFYERICKVAPEILSKNGVLAFEIGFDQEKSVYEIMKNNFKNIDYVPDLSGVRRVIYGKLR